jgi:PTH1 family peptidyl-tRNA hydrolase
MKLIVGLGNPGRAYSGKRHNVGFTSLRHLARGQGIRFDKKKGQARIGGGIIAGQNVVLARPQTYMNLSGRSVSRLMKVLNAGLDDLIVIHDDIDLPLGTIRIRRGGNSGGQKGVESIIIELGSRDFIRIRIGIGRPAAEATGARADQTEVIHHVLGDFSPAENKVIGQVIPRVSQAIVCLLEEGLTATMSRYNQSFAGQ